MRRLLPIVELLADCTTDAERAAWLLRVPQGVIQRDHMSIRAVLREAGFLTGVDCLDAEFSMINATRLADGGHPHAAIKAVEDARAVLRLVAHGGTLPDVC